MRYLFFIVLIVLFPSIVMANTFSDLDYKCIWETDGLHSKVEDKLILKHINKRITKTEWYVKIDNYLYMVANTFTDNYRFLGSYFLRYDCKEKKIDRLSPRLRWNIPNELGFLWFDDNTYNMSISLVGNMLNKVWIYDYSEQKLKYVDYKKVIKPSKKHIFLSTDLSSYDGNSVNIQLLYYTKIQNWDQYTYEYENYNNPDIVRYNF